MHLFNIAGVDLTKHIVAPSYIMNEKDVYNEWEDANYVKHRNVIRTRIEGKFTMKFMEKEVYYNFLDLMKNNRTSSGDILASLYVNNMHKVVSTNVFIEYAPANTIPLFRNGTYNGFEVKVTER